MTTASAQAAAQIGFIKYVRLSLSDVAETNETPAPTNSGATYLRGLSHVLIGSRKPTIRVL